VFGLNFKYIEYFKTRTLLHGKINRNHQSYLDGTYKNCAIILIIKFKFSTTFKIHNKSIVKLKQVILEPVLGLI
jgi:hypothetical protein